MDRMTTPLAIDTAHATTASHDSVVYLDGPGARPSINTPLWRLQQAQLQLAELRQALASSREESVATRHQIDLLEQDNAQLRRFDEARERKIAKEFGSPTSETDAKLSDRPAPPDRPNPSSDAGEPETQGAGVARHGFARGSSRSSNWAVSEFCLCAGLDPEATMHVERLLTKRIRFRKGDVLFRVGGWFDALYAIRMGSCKTALLAPDGQGQVAGYHMSGEVIGLDGIGGGTHACQATALEDMEVCPLPFDQVENLARQSEAFQCNLYKLLAQESLRAHALMLVLGTMRAEQRLAVFLLDLSQRYRMRGYSPCEFVLRMSREEIGSYLGLKLETVSRLFSRFQRDGLIQVQARAVKLLDPVGVSRLAEGAA